MFDSSIKVDKNSNEIVYLTNNDASLKTHLSQQSIQSLNNSVQYKQYNKSYYRMSD